MIQVGSPRTLRPSHGSIRSAGASAQTDGGAEVPEIPCRGIRNLGPLIRDAAHALLLRRIHFPRGCGRPSTRVLHEHATSHHMAYCNHSRADTGQRIDRLRSLRTDGWWSSGRRRRGERGRAKPRGQPIAAERCGHERHRQAFTTDIHVLGA